jgi:hypothetical protein
MTNVGCDFLDFTPRADVRELTKPEVPDLAGALERALDGLSVCLPDHHVREEELPSWRMGRGDIVNRRWKGEESKYV